MAKKWTEDRIRLRKMNQSAVRESIQSYRSNELYTFRNTEEKQQIA